MKPCSNWRTGVVTAGLFAALVMSLSGCVADLEAADKQEREHAALPMFATYDCGEDGGIFVENYGTTVRLLETEGDSYDLPAAPPAQENRFGQGGYALVIDGPEALWMKAGSTPITCRR